MHNPESVLDFSFPVDQQVKLKESEKIHNYLDLARELKKTLEHKGVGYTNCNWRAQYRHQKN